MVGDCCLIINFVVVVNSKRNKRVLLNRNNFKTKSSLPLEGHLVATQNLDVTPCLWAASNSGTGCVLSFYAKLVRAKGKRAGHPAGVIYYFPGVDHRNKDNLSPFAVEHTSIRYGLKKSDFVYGKT